jgi:hypothetical protein
MHLTGRQITIYSKIVNESQVMSAVKTDLDAYPSRPAGATSVLVPSQPSYSGPTEPFSKPQPGSTEDVEQILGPSYTPNATMIHPAATTEVDLKGLRSSAELGLREYVSLQRRQYTADEVGMDQRLRLQAETVREDLRMLRRNVSDMIRAAEAHRWRRWLLGGLM